uniref:Uncharacterized protein n=1 Tax=Cacopsylla melanoneura TaxID=428564 RepID=A0A8D9FB74_9HEMI
MQIVLYFEFDVQLPSLPAFALLYHCHCHCQIRMNIHKSQIVRDIHVNSTPRAEMEHCSWQRDQLGGLSTNYYHWEELNQPLNRLSLFEYLIHFQDKHLELVETSVSCVGLTLTNSGNLSGAF